jgi:glucan phosphoethanolaminetransferase (alkaline phosphatase superfamily)
MQRIIREVSATILTTVLLLVPTIIYLTVLNSAFDTPRAQTLDHFAVTAIASIAQAIAIVCFSARKDRRMVVRLVFVAWILVWVTATVVFYAMNLTAFSAWGRAPTLDLVAAYVTQIRALWATLSAKGAVIWISGSVALLLFAATLTRLSFAAATARKRISRDNGHRSSKTSWSGLGSMFFAAGGAVFLFVHSITPTTRWSEDTLHTFVQGTNNKPTAEALIPLLTKIGDPNRRALDDKVRAEYQPTDLDNRPHVVLIVVDALRPDHLGVYGYGRDTTPHLSAMKDLGFIAIQREARAACAESTCGILSLLSGRHSNELLAKSFDLPSALSKHGYERIFYLSGDHTHFYRSVAVR